MERPADPSPSQLQHCETFGQLLVDAFEIGNRLLTAIGNARNEHPRRFVEGEQEIADKLVGALEAPTEAPSLAKLRDPLPEGLWGHRELPIESISATLSAFDQWFTKVLPAYYGRGTEVITGKTYPAAHRLVLACGRNPMSRLIGDEDPERVVDETAKGDPHLAEFMHNYRILEETSPSLRIHRLPEDLDCALASVSEDAKFGLYPLTSEIRYVLEAVDQPIGVAKTPYLFKRLEDEAPMKDAIDRALDLASSKGVHVAIFPELSVTETLLKHMQARLKTGAGGLSLQLVLAGSFHGVYDGDNGGIKVTRNRLTVLNGRGQSLWTYDKVVRFTLTQKLAARIGLEVGARGGVESLRAGETLPLWDSPLGRIATPICIDYFDRRMQERHCAGLATLFLVPAMSPTLEHFKDPARSYGERVRATTLVVNSRWVVAMAAALEGKAVRDEHLGYAYAPAHGASRSFSAGAEADLVCFRDLVTQARTGKTTPSSKRTGARLQPNSPERL